LNETKKTTSVSIQYEPILEEYSTLPNITLKSQNTQNSRNSKRNNNTENGTKEQYIKHQDDNQNITRVKTETKYNISK